MGHQFSYYMTPKDTQEVERKLRSSVPMSIITRKSFSEKPRVLESFLFEESDSWPLSLALVRPEDLEKVVMDCIPATRRYWTAEITDSPIIEFGKCRFDGEMLLLARMYYVDGFYGKDGTWIEKSEEFKAFAKKVFSITKKLLKRFDTSYIGADAHAWAEAGGTLVQSIEVDRVIVESARIPPR